MIRARQIEKRYGSFQAVWPLDLEVRPGEVFGFLGLNGAGKTTTLRMLGGVLPPTGVTSRSTASPCRRTPSRPADG